MRVLPIALLLAPLTACGSVSPHARATAGRIGCAADDITIQRREGEENGPRSWTATCGSRRYACSGGRDLAEPRGVVCTEIGSDAPRASRLGSAR
ncbi:MAG: hypothetical protein ABW252_24935 [Polyangiales bacterium]